MSGWPFSLNLLRFYPKKLASVCAGWAASAQWPKIIQVAMLRRFASHYDIDLYDAEKPIEEYKSLQEFFTRRLKDGVRPQAKALPGAINSPADAVLIAKGRIQSGTLIQAKGLPYSLHELLKHMPMADSFEGGHYLTLYLSPKDYHRVHAPLAGHVKAVSRVEGELWPVNDASTNNIPRLYERNRRAAWLAEGKSHNEGLLVACVLIGATHVGGCVIDKQWLEGRNLPKDGGLLVSNLPCEPGDELGMFQFGSTVVMLIGGPEADNWQPTVEGGSVKVGQCLGMYR